MSQTVTNYRRVPWVWKTTCDHCESSVVAWKTAKNQKQLTGIPKFHRKTHVLGDPKSRKHNKKHGIGQSEKNALPKPSVHLGRNMRNPLSNWYGYKKKTCKSHLGTKKKRFLPRMWRFVNPSPKSPARQRTKSRVLRSNVSMTLKHLPTRFGGRPPGLPFAYR